MKKDDNVIPHGGFFSRLRTWFFAGVLVVAPIGITIYIAQLFIDFVDGKVLPAIPIKYNPMTYLPVDIPGLGLLILMVCVTLIGMMTAGFVGRWFVRSSEAIVNRMPVIRTLYGSLKQILETVLAQKSTAFRDVVLVEYPRREMWVIGFVSGKTTGEVQAKTDDEVINVFIPTTPNPTSGFLIFVPRRDMVFLNMTIEEGIKMVVSGGIVTPEYLPEKIPSYTPHIDLYHEDETSAEPTQIPVNDQPERKSRTA